MTFDINAGGRGERIDSCRKFDPHYFLGYKMKMITLLYLWLQLEYLPELGEWICLHQDDAELGVSGL